MKKCVMICTMCLFFTSLCPVHVFGGSDSFSQVPVMGMVTMLDLGAETCLPCEMMAPIIENVKEEYQGIAAVESIDVWENPEQGQKFGIRAIPTQIFFDRQGNEVFRHTGFMDKERIGDLLEEFGAY